MKESMRVISQTSDYRFSDARVGQLEMFRPDQRQEVIDFARSLFENFQNQTVPWQEINDYALNETPFLNATAMLKWLEENGLIVIKRKSGASRQAYNEDSVVAVQFTQPSERQESLAWSA